MYLNTQQLIDTLSGKNKSFIKRVAKHQEEKYGNADIFSAIIGEKYKYSYGSEYTYIEMQFGENWIDFTFNAKGEIVDTYGIGQGHKYHKNMEECAKEFCEFAKAHPEKHFLVTPIGCGIAGFSEADVAPMFEACRDLTNVSLPSSFWDIIG